MSTQNENNSKKLQGIIKYVAGLLGFLGIFLAIATLTGLVTWYLEKIKYTGGFSDQTQLLLSLSSSILGIFFLFIAFSKQLDKFFGFLETHTIKTDKTGEKKGVTIESAFFFIIALILIVLAVMLANNNLELRTNLPLLGEATKGVLIGALVLLSLLAIITAFNDIITQSLREMKKVHWPSGKEMKDYSAKVFVFIFFFSLLFLTLDIVINYTPKLLENIFHIDL